MNAYDIAKDLDREGKFPGHVCYGTSPLLVRAANMLRQQADRIAELEKYKEKIEQMEQAYDNHFKKALGVKESE
jgi:hypothetical protein